MKRIKLFVAIFVAFIIFAIPVALHANNTNGVPLDGMMLVTEEGLVPVLSLYDLQDGDMVIFPGETIQISWPEFYEQAESEAATQAALDEIFNARGFDFYALEVGMVFDIFVEVEGEPTIYTFDTLAEFEAVFGAIEEDSDRSSIPNCCGNGPFVVTISPSFNQSWTLVQVLFNQHGQQIGVYLRCTLHTHPATRHCQWCGHFTSAPSQTRPGCGMTRVQWN